VLAGALHLRCREREPHLTLGPPSPPPRQLLEAIWSVFSRRCRTAGCAAAFAFHSGGSGQAARRDPLQRYKIAQRRQGATASHPAALVDWKQLALGVGCAATRRRPPLTGGQRRPNPGHAAESGDQCPKDWGDLVDHRGHRSTGSRHPGPAQGAGLERTRGRVAVRMTS